MGVLRAHTRVVETRRHGMGLSHLAIRVLQQI